MKSEAAELPEDTEINSNGAGDSFTSGLLVAAMLRHTGLFIPVEEEGPSEATEKNDIDEAKGKEATLSINSNLVNTAMNLETAAHFASLVASRHIDTSTRDSNYLDINKLREQSSVSTSGLEEI